MGQGSRIKISSSPASRTEAGQIYRRLLLFRRTTIGLWGANDYSFHIRTNSRSDMKPLLIRGQTTIAVALTFYRFAHALWWLFLTIA